MKPTTAMFLSYGLLFLLIGLIWWLGICDGIVLQITGQSVGNGTHIFSVAGGNMTGNCLNWTITN